MIVNWRKLCQLFFDASHCVSLASALVVPPPCWIRTQRQRSTLAAITAAEQVPALEHLTARSALSARHYALKVSKSDIQDHLGKSWNFTSAEATQLRGFRGSDSNAVRREHVRAIYSISIISPRDAHQPGQLRFSVCQTCLLCMFALLCCVCSSFWHVCGVPEVMLRIEGSRFLRLRAPDGLRWCRCSWWVFQRISMSGFSSQLKQETRCD